MSVVYEKKMEEWAEICKPITSEDYYEDKVLCARSKALTNLLQTWLNCDKAHTEYTIQARGLVY